MRKEIVIDLTGATNESDIVYRFRKALNLFPHVSEKDWIERVESNRPVNWDAFTDDMRDLHDTIGLQNGDELVLYVSGINDVKNRGLKTMAGEDMVAFLSEILLWLTDPTAGPNTFKLFPQYILE